MTKSFYVNNKKVVVTLTRDRFGIYRVAVNGDVYKTTANELFAVQCFNAI